jgi:hypothetical protein
LCLLQVRAALHAHGKNVEGADMANLAAGFVAGQGVGGYGEDLEAEGKVITVNGSGNDKGAGGKPSSKLLSKFASKAHANPASSGAANLELSRVPTRAPSRELPEENIGSLI